MTISDPLGYFRGASAEDWLRILNDFRLVLGYQPHPGPLVIEELDRWLVELEEVSPGARALFEEMARKEAIHRERMRNILGPKKRLRSLCDWCLKYYPFSRRFRETES